MVDLGFVERGFDVVEGLKFSGFRVNFGGGLGGECILEFWIYYENNK